MVQTFYPTMEEDPESAGALDPYLSSSFDIHEEGRSHGYEDGVNSGAYHHHTEKGDTATFLQHPHTVITGILLSLMLILFILLCYLTIPLVRDYIRSKMPVSTLRKERRFLTIEGWLITKKARAHCGMCQEVQQQYKQPAPKHKLQLSPSYDTAETEPMRDFDDANVETPDEVDSGKECPVCMERFKENDIVSWSPTEECGHVFHHECIKEWLVFHDNCPYCRVTVLPVDDLKTKTRSGVMSAAWGNAELTRLAKQRTIRARTSYFCIEEGLITIDKPIPPSMDTRKHRRFLGSRIKPGELTNLRGSRPSCEHSACRSGSASNGAVPCVASPISTESGTSAL